MDILLHFAVAAAAEPRHSHCPAMSHGHQFCPVPPVDVAGAHGVQESSSAACGDVSDLKQVSEAMQERHSFWELT